MQQKINVKTNGTLLKLELAPELGSLKVDLILTHAEARALVGAIEDTLVTRDPSMVTVEGSI